MSDELEINEDGKYKISLNRLQELTLNYAFNRLQYLQNIIDPNKDLYKDCGYPQPGTITAKMYKEMYEREVGKRVVELEPKECWKIPPCIYEVEDEDIETPFEQAWEEFIKNFGGANFFDQKKGSKVYSHLYRADMVSGIGRYGILLLGFDDGQALDQPIPERVLAEEKGEVRPPSTPRKLLYMQSYDEEQALIVNLVDDPKNPRNGLPEYYNLTITNELTTTSSQSTVKVHWSRVIHVALDRTTSEVLATPRQEAVYNRLIDLRKLYASSGEMYYRGAFPGIALQNLPGYTGTINTEDAKEQLFNYMNSLQRWIGISGVEPKSLALQVASPKDQIECQIEAICIIKEIPLRIFKGSERGELASTTDKDSWEERVQNRRNTQVTPNLIIPFINALIISGVLPIPTEGLNVTWDMEKELNAVTQSTVVKNYSEAIATYVNSNSRSLITPHNFFTKILKMSSDEADSLIEDANNQEPPDLPEDEELPTNGNPPTQTTTTEGEVS